MADKRRRIYYTKAQITNGLITKGKEWMFKDTTEYIGQYHRYSTDEVFSEPSYVDGKSKILIPYVDVNIINQQNEIGIDFTKNFEYDAIKKIDIKKSITPNPSQINPTDKDRKRGWMERYFAQKVNDESFKSGSIARMLALPLEVIARKNIGLAEAYLKYYKNKKKDK